MRNSGRGSWMAVVGAVLAGIGGAAGRTRSPPGASGNRRKSAWEQLQPGQKDEVFRFADGYKSYLNGLAQRADLDARGAAPREGRRASRSSRTPAQVKSGARLIVNGRDRAVILVVVGSDPIVSGSRVIGTHHDSPHIDLKARPIYSVERIHALQDDLLRRHQEVPVGQPRRSR